MENAVGKRGVFYRCWDSALARDVPYRHPLERRHAAAGAAATPGCTTETDLQHPSCGAKTSFSLPVYTKN